MQRVIKFLLVIALGALGMLRAEAQISIDRGVRLEGLWCFPLATDSTQYLYLPDESHLTLDKQNNPQFSFIRYVSSMLDDKDTSSSTIRKAKGGGILHFLLSYDTDERKVRRAQSKLKELTGNDEVKLKGPIVFKEGRFALVSSVLNNATGNNEKKLIAIGEAPVLEGSRIALSFEVDPERSKLLLESFKMNTPDVSLVFDLTFSGLTDAYNAKLTVDWSEVQKYEKIAGGANVYFDSAELEKVYEELKRKNAIKLETSGTDGRMDALVNNAYNKLTDLLFRRIETEQANPADRAGINNLLESLFSNSGGGGAFSSSKLFGFGAHAAYKLKDIKTSGSSVLHFTSRVFSDRHHYIAFNIGDVYKKYGSDTQYFNTVSLSDPDFEQRDIYVGIDGAILPEFDKLINSVTVTLRKQHVNGSTTLNEVNLTKQALKDAQQIKMSYGSVSDTDRNEWLNYDYKAQFQFKGGKTYATPWQQQSASMINLFAPYERKTIRLEGDADLLKSTNVRAIVIQVSYPFFGEIRRMETSVRPEENFQGKQFDLTLPLNQFSYNYTLKWRFKNGTEKTFSGTNDSELLFIDSIPQ